MSESLARVQWPGENPLGKTYWEKDTVVAVVGNARINSPNEDDAVEKCEPAQLSDVPVHGDRDEDEGAPDGMTPAVKSVVQSLDPKLFHEIRLLKAAFRKNIQSLELSAMVVSLIGVVGVLLAGGENGTGAPAAAINDRTIRPANIGSAREGAISVNHEAAQETLLRAAT